MINNYLKTAWRSMRTQVSTTAINVLGLAMGLAVSMLIFLWVADEYNYDRFHTQLPQLYRVMRNFKEGEGKIWTTSSHSALLSEYLQKNIPEFKAVSNVMPSYGPMTISYGDRGVKKDLVGIEPAFLEMFSFPMLKGSPQTAFKELNSVVLTASMAQELIGDEDPMGKTVRLSGGYDVVVSGIIQDPPRNTRFKFDCLVSFAFLKSKDMMYYGWSANNCHVMAELHPGTDVAAVNEKIKDVYRQNDPNTDNGSPFLHPIGISRLYSRFEQGKLVGGRIEQVRLFSIIALLVLFIACINYMNLSTARSGKRTQEVGIRKAVGASRWALGTQFLSESLLTTTCAFVLAIILVACALPSFNTLMDKQLSLPWANPLYWGGALAFIGLSSLLAGSYPAFYLSALDPKKSMKRSTASSIPRKVMVVAQFCCSIVLMIFTTLVYQQVQMGKNRPLGYNQKNLVSIEMEDELPKKFETLRNELLASGAVTDVCASSHTMLLKGNNSWGLSWRGKDPAVQTVFENVRVSGNFFEMTGLRMRDGRAFYSEGLADSLSLIANEAAVKVMGFTNPLGELVNWDDNTYQIVGVVEDFAFGSPFEPTEPTLFRSVSANRVYNALMRLNGSRPVGDNLAAIEAVVKKVNPGFPVDVQFVDSEYAKAFEDEELLGTLAGVFGGLAIFISCLGLFGLTNFMVERRQKEIGIRKVLGADIARLVFNLTSEFLILVGVAFLIASPIAWYYGHRFLEQFTYRTNLHWTIFAATGITALLIAFGTVAFQSVKAASANPVKALRSE